jgi:hypothetical protein
MKLMSPVATCSNRVALAQAAEYALCVLVCSAQQDGLPQTLQVILHPQRLHLRPKLRSLFARDRMSPAKGVEKLIKCFGSELRQGLYLKTKKSS